MYYDKSAVETCTSGLVGWQQSTDPSHFTLTVANMQSTSGYYVDSLPGVSWELINEAIGKNEVNMNAYLGRVFSEERTKLVNKSVQSIKDQLGTKELLSNFDPLTGRASFQDKVIQDARFVGFLIMPQESENLRAEITHIGMQIDTIQVNPVKIYLYDTSQSDAIATYDYTNTKLNSLEWFSDLTDFVINYRSDTAGTAQSFLLGYYEQDPANVQTSQLSGQALYFNFCSGCPNETKRRKLHQKYIGIAPIQIPNSALNWNGADYDLPDTDNLEGRVCQSTHGLYLKFNITCDISHVICMNKDIYAEPLQYAMAVRVLSDAIDTHKHNAVSDAKHSRDNMRQWMLKYQAELNGYQLEGGMWHKGAIDRMVLDISNLDQFCLPCKFNKPILGRINRR